ncbi:MAG TPA: 50S ribosomal protein L10, partial [Candidatus Thermoplasmatota archaeon]|nr:50S ribosomal protein L10 [Candidatus Thermoplasmatota archaeon]
MSFGSTEGHAHVAPWKKDEVKRLTKILLDNPVVAVAEVGGIPGPQMQSMRSSLRGNVHVVGSKNRLLAIALQEASKSRPGLEGL